MKNKSALLRSSLPYLICLLFFIAYCTLGVIKHLHYLSGYDLAVMDQAIWKYSQFRSPVSTNHAYPFTSILTDHIELVFILIAPFYWIYNSALTPVILQALLFCVSGIPVYLFARQKKLKYTVSLAILISYFMFYGIQQALWSDVHSLIFGISFLAWFLYFLEMKKKKYIIIFFLLAITAKEDLALLTGIVSGLYFLKYRQKFHLTLIGLSFLYLLFVFTIYFPYFVPGGYRFESEGGMLSNINFANAYNTKEKRDVWLYTFSSFGFLPLLQPLYLLPAIGDLLKYFVIANENVTSGQSIFGHYRSSLALLMAWPTILAIAKYKQLNNTLIAGFLLFCTLFMQYHLHSPLSYLTKKWFWQESPSVKTINMMLENVSSTASIVTPVNISAHVAHRNEAFIFWPTKITPKDNPACLQKECDWLRWPGKPQYLLVDLSPEWDARYVLTNNETFQAAIKNLEAGGVVKKQKQIDTTVLYTIHKFP